MKIVYLDSDEIARFREMPSSYLDGCAYEWENEDVAHLHISPISHSFGLSKSCKWYKSNNNDFIPNEKDTYYIYINENDVINVHYVAEVGETCTCNVYIIPSQKDLFSRAKGILEVDILLDKHVLIIGLGSFGSQISIELAKAGVGYFTLVDFDRVEIHNLARHTCTTKDLGRLKIDAIKELILGKNKCAHVETFPIDITKNFNLLNEMVAKADLIICATDNNTSRFTLANCLIKQNKVGIFGRAVTRAEGGDVFRQRPNGPCYNCLVGSATHSAIQEEVTNREQLPAYVSAQDADAMIQVGLSSDIEPICNFMVKLSLLELSKGRESGIEHLENELTYDYYIWANRRERRHLNWASFNNAVQKPTILRWYGAKIQKDDYCPICSNHIILDEGDELIQLLDEDYNNISIDTIEKE